MAAGDPGKQVHSTVGLLDLRGEDARIEIELTCVAYQHPLVTLPSMVKVKGGT